MTAPAPMDTVELLLEVWQCERSLDYPGIRRLLEPLPLSTLLATEEFALLLLYAHNRLMDLAKSAELLEAAAPCFPPERDDRNRRRFLFAKAEVLMHRGRLSESEALLQDLEARSVQAQDTPSVLQATINLAVTSGIRGDNVQAIRHTYRALAIPDPLNGDRWTPVLHHNLGVSYRELGLIAEAERHFEQAGRYPRPEWMKAITDLDRAVLRHVVGESVTAERIAQHSLAVLERAGAHGRVAECWCVLGAIATSMGDLSAARNYLDAALRSLPPGNVLLPGQVHEELAVLHLLEGDTEAHHAARMTAARLYEQIDALPRMENMRVRLEVLAARQSQRLPGRPG